MKFPGKKHRFSRFISDLRWPSKRGGSFIVETGFPASLVDLFIETRYRLQNSSSKKKPRRGIRSPIASPPHHPNSIKNNACDHIEVNTDQELSPKSAIAAVLKGLVAVVLALSLKSLLVGIALSGFVLLSLEYVIKLVEAVMIKNNGCSEVLVSTSESESKQCTEIIEARVADSGRDEDSKKRSRSRRGIKSKIVNKWKALKKKIKRRELDHDHEEEQSLISHSSSDVDQDCVEEEVEVRIEESETRRSGRGANLGCLMLVLVILVGLVGGRIGFGVLCSLLFGASSYKLFAK